VVEAWILHEVPEGTGETRFPVRGPKHQCVHAREHESARAHRAWLERHVEGAAVQSPRTDGFAGRAQREDLGVGGRIPVAFPPVAGCGQDFLAPGHDSAHGHVPELQADSGL